MRYPLEPLAEAAHITLGAPKGDSNNTSAAIVLVGMSLLAARLNISTRTLQRARRNGLTDTQADHWACTLGIPPRSVWGTLWDTGALTDDELDEITSHRRRLQWRHHTRTLLRTRPTHPHHQALAA